MPNMIDTFIIIELSLPFLYSPKMAGKTGFEPVIIEVWHGLTVRLAEGLGLEPRNRSFSMCKINSLVRLPIPPPPQGSSLYSAVMTPGLQDCVQATYKKARLTLSQLTTLASAPKQGFYSSLKLRSA